MHTIVETNHFRAAAKKLLSESERESLIMDLAEDPEIGDLIQGTGGFRKMRLAREGGSKRDGYRVIYYYYNESLPVFLFTIYAKAQRENLTKAQQNALYALSEAYQNYGE